MNSHSLLNASGVTALRLRTNTASINELTSHSDDSTLKVDAKINMENNDITGLNQTTTNNLTFKGILVGNEIKAINKATMGNVTAQTITSPNIHSDNATIKQITENKLTSQNDENELTLDTNVNMNNNKITGVKEISSSGFISNTITTNNLISLEITSPPPKK